jgi:hypothetical protein
VLLLQRAILVTCLLHLRVNYARPSCSGRRRKEESIIQRKRPEKGNLHLQTQSILCGSRRIVRDCFAPQGPRDEEFDMYRSCNSMLYGVSRALVTIATKSEKLYEIGRAHV